MNQTSETVSQIKPLPFEVVAVNHFVTVIRKLTNINYRLGFHFSPAYASVRFCRLTGETRRAPEVQHQSNPAALHVGWVPGPAQHVPSPSLKEEYG